MPDTRCANSATIAGRSLDTGLVVLVQTFLAALVVIGRHGKNAIGVHALALLGEFDDFAV
jgi:hypothetical protein